MGEHEGFMAEASKLSAGKALEKLRGTEKPKSKMARQDENIDALKEKIRCLRAATRRLAVNFQSRQFTYERKVFCLIPCPHYRRTKITE